MVKIRRPKIEELEEIMPLWLGQADYHHKIDSKYYTEVNENKDFLIKAIEKNNPYILIALDNGKVAGFITFEESKADYFDTRIKKYAEVQELFVDASFRGKGIGRMLIAEVEKLMKEKGISWVKIQCSTKNPDALKFYEKLNYTDSQRLLFKEIK